MKFLDEYRKAEPIRQTAREITRIATRRWTVMEICGGQTHSILRHGIDQLLKDPIAFLHGPGCPVCVTSVELVDKAIAIAQRPNVILCSFGDMLRVPGSRQDLLSAKAKGADVRIVYSPLDSLRLAQKHPDNEVVFFGVGFETTAPANAMAVAQAKRLGVRNFSILAAQVMVPPAIRAILTTPEIGVQGFIGPGHVCTVTGYREYEKLAEEFGVPFVVTGFEPLDLVEGVLMLVRQFEEGRHEVENQYARSVLSEGNRAAIALLEDVFKVVDRKWRGIGEIPKSGYGLSDAYAEFDAERRFEVSDLRIEEASECISGLVLQGLKKPTDCPAFGTRCTPERPLGATMVSNEGACAAYFAYCSHTVGANT